MYHAMKLRLSNKFGARHEVDSRRLESWNLRQYSSDPPGLSSTTPLPRNPVHVRDGSQQPEANLSFGDEGAVDRAFLGNLKQLRALLLG